MKNKKILLGIFFTILSLTILTANTVIAVEIDNPLNVDNPRDLVGQIINAILGLVGVIALIYFIVGGFMWMTAGGNAEKIKKGRDTLIWAILGLIIIFASYSLVNFVLEDLVG